MTRWPGEPGLETEGVISKKEKKAKKKAEKQGRSPVALLAKPEAKVRDYEAHVFVCKGGDCKKRGSKETSRAIKTELRARGMNRDVRIDSVDCLGLCKHGPNVVVYPDGTWYLGLDADAASEVVERHLKDGEPVEELAAELRSRHEKAKK